MDCSHYIRILHHSMCAIGLAINRPREPTLYEQAIGINKVIYFGRWSKNILTNTAEFGDIIINQIHFMETGNEKDKKQELVFELYYPCADILAAYKAAGVTNNFFDFMEKRDPIGYKSISEDRGFIYAACVAGAGRGISLRKINGKYSLWNNAPVAFGNNYDTAGLVEKENFCYLYSKNQQDASIIAFLSPTLAERHYDSGKIESLSATPSEAAKVKINKSLSSIFNAPSFKDAGYIFLGVILGTVVIIFGHRLRRDVNGARTPSLSYSSSANTPPKIQRPVSSPSYGVAASELSNDPLTNFRRALAYLDSCSSFNEQKLREVNRMAGDLLSESTIQKLISQAQMIMPNAIEPGGMDFIKAQIREQLVELIRMGEKFGR